MVAKLPRRRIRAVRPARPGEGNLCALDLHHRRDGPDLCAVPGRKPAVRQVAPGKKLREPLAHAPQRCAADLVDAVVVPQRVEAGPAAALLPQLAHHVVGVRAGAEEEHVVLHQRGAAVPGAAAGGAVEEPRQRRDGAHAAGAVVGDGERGHDGFRQPHEAALLPGDSGDLGWVLVTMVEVEIQACVGPAGSGKESGRWHSCRHH